MRSGQTRQYRRFARRGSGYVLILGAAALVSVIGLTSLTVSRVQWQAELAGMAAGRARLFARSGIEAAVAYTMVDANWRANYATLASYMPMSLANGSCSVQVSELDGTTLIYNADTPVLLTGTGIVGSPGNPDALTRWSVQAHHAPLDILKTALYSASGVNARGADLDLEDGPIATAGTLTNTGSIRGDVQAGSVSNWGWISGSVESNVPAKQMPIPAVWDYYNTLPTRVVLPTYAVGSAVEWVLLGPTSNPWDSSKQSTDGLYYIYPSGDLRIRDCRIIGTLLVELPPGRKLIIEHGVLWSPARPDFPSLIVKGICEMRVESYVYELGRVNLNPSGAAFEGEWDYDRWDSFSSCLKGLFHVMGSSSTLFIDTQTRVQGCIIADGYVTIEDSVDLIANPNLYLNPPARYRMGSLELDPGTWQPVVSTSN